MSLVTSILQRNVRCDRVILISPFLTDPDELRQVAALGSEIWIYQSEADILRVEGFKVEGFKVEEGDPFRQEVNVVDVRDVTHTQWIPCFNYAFVQPGGTSNRCTEAFNRAAHSKALIAAARDPNAKLVDRALALPGDTLNYTVQFENEGEGSAYGVYITDQLESDIDASSLVLQSGEGGVFDATSRTISWFVGEVGPGQTGERRFSARVRADAPCGTQVANFATVYFPSVPEVTPTNGVMVMVTGTACDGDDDGVPDSGDNCPTVANADQANADGDSLGNACDHDADNDEMPNAYESLYSCLNPLVDDAQEDADEDGATNLQEFRLSTPFSLGFDPCDPQSTPVVVPGLAPAVNVNALFPSVPNPATGSVLVRFALARPGVAQLEIFVTVV